MSWCELCLFETFDTMVLCHRQHAYPQSERPATCRAGLYFNYLLTLITGSSGVINAGLFVDYRNDQAHYR